MKFRRLALLGVLAFVGAILLWQRMPRQIVSATNYNSLTSEERRVILRDGTERAFSGLYHDSKGSGIYTCKQCDRPLFESDSKFDSRTGWPSFDDFIVGAIREVPDGGRTEIECSNCGGHIGHVFLGEGFTPRNTRHCANSISLNFVAVSNEKRAIFAGGCFWGVEYYMEKIPGVLSATSGYVGGRKANPTYEDVLSKTTGHAEAVEVEFDPDVVSYQDLLAVFWTIHDPTTPDRQGPDVGTQYRSAIFIHNPKQGTLARVSREELAESGRYRDPIVTEVLPANQFYRAEDYHQDYIKKNRGRFR